MNIHWLIIFKAYLYLNNIYILRNSNQYPFYKDKVALSLPQNIFQKFLSSLAFFKIRNFYLDCIFKIKNPPESCNCWHDPHFLFFSFYPAGKFIRNIIRNCHIGRLVYLSHPTKPLRVLTNTCRTLKRTPLKRIKELRRGSTSQPEMGINNYFFSG